MSLKKSIKNTIEREDDKLGLFIFGGHKIWSSDCLIMYSIQAMFSYLTDAGRG